MPKGISRNDLWVVWIPGKAGSDWEGGKYPVTITFPPNYPLAPPQIAFPSDFQHVHVYEGGAICMPLLEGEHWKSKIRMSDIIQRVINIIHQDVNPYSPANPHLFQLYREHPQLYRHRLQQQAQLYATQSAALFALPSVHINVLTD